MNLSQEDIRHRVRRLWATVFPDDADAFLDLYFSEKYEAETSVVRLKDGDVAAAGQFFTSEARIFGKPTHVGYVSGVSTAPAYRHRGLASSIMKEGIRLLQRRGCTLVCLIPQEEQLRSFYEAPACGAFRTASYLRRTLHRPSHDTFSDIIVSSTTDWDGRHFVLYEQQTAALPFVIFHSKADLQLAHDSLLIDHGTMLSAFRGHHLVGWAFAALVPPTEQGALVKFRDIVAADEEVKAALVRAACEQFGSVAVLEDIPSQIASFSRPYAQFRVADLPAFLRLVASAQPSLTFRFNLKDEILPENSGSYSLSAGQVNPVAAHDAPMLGAGELAAQFLSSHPFHMRNMLDE